VVQNRWIVSDVSEERRFGHNDDPDSEVSLRILLQSPLEALDDLIDLFGVRFVTQAVHHKKCAWHYDALGGMPVFEISVFFFFLCFFAFLVSSL
jgi:hypothetical protein